MALLDFFGFSFKKKDEQEKELLSPVPQTNDDESIVVSSVGGFSNTYYNLEFNTSSKNNLIDKYRELSLQSTIESAIDEIINEAIVTGDPEPPVGIIVDNLPYSDQIKDVIVEEFNNVLNLLDFNENAYEIFKRWYVDGRIYFNVVIDSKNVSDGIQELRYIDPKKIDKIKEVKDEVTKRGVIIQKPISEYYVYNGIKIPADSVATTNSGLIDYKNGGIILSYLHKAIKPFNQLRMLEDAAVIYRIARAPERRIFKISTGGLPKLKAEQYINDLMNKFKNKIVYDSNTGDLRDDTRTLSMLEDFWIPVNDEGKGTDISTLPGGTALGELGDVAYFRKNLYNSLHVPGTRITEGSTFNSGRAAEIDREEVKFNKFIKRLRTRFSTLFSDLLRKQLILKNIVTVEDWDVHIKNNIYFDYRKDSHFAEYNEAEIMTRRIELASSAISLGEDYFSPEYIKKNFLKLSEEEIDDIKIDNDESPEEESPEDEPEIMGSGGFEEPGFEAEVEPTVSEPVVPETPPENLELS